MEKLMMMFVIMLAPKLISSSNIVPTTWKSVYVKLVDQSSRIFKFQLKAQPHMRPYRNEPVYESVEHFFKNF
jgi:hypothetical protein